MKRRLPNLLTALSLLLCVAVVVLWVRSYFVADWITRTTVRPGGIRRDVTEWVSFSSEGLIQVSAGSFQWGNGPPPFAGSTTPGVAWRWKRNATGDLRETPSSPRKAWHRLGFGMNGWGGRHEETGNTCQGHSLMFPLWLPAAFFAVWPLARTYRHRRRHPSGHCALCGYDLRATPRRCPECGSGIPSPPASD
jgi:hypothetical protein